MAAGGLRVLDGVNVIPVDGLWESVSQAPAGQKMSQALEYAGCSFYDDSRLLVAGHVIAVAGLGGTPAAFEKETDGQVRARLHGFVDGSRQMMANSAALSYLNSGEKALPDLYDTVTGLGHLSVAHTVSLNFLVAGITEGTELELSLQRDLVHISKVTNARTRVQNTPPIVVRHPEHVPAIAEWYGGTAALAARLRGDGSPDDLEFANSFYPVNKATLLMLSGDLSNMRKLAQFRDDGGKERELRDVADGIFGQLNALWPEIMEKRKVSNNVTGEKSMPKTDYFADSLLAKLDGADPVYATYEAQDISRDVGFDFADFQDVVPRALDEIRETREAFAEEGPEGREHFGDEIADIMFSLVNLVRHAGITDLPKFSEITGHAVRRPVSKDDTLARVAGIGAGISRVAELEKSGDSSFTAELEALFDNGMADCAALAEAHGFDAETLLRENVRKYLIRCQAIEQLASEDGKQWSDLSARGEIIDYWKKAKALLK